MSSLSAATAPNKVFNRHFFLLWQGQLVSQVGSQIFLVAMLFGTMETTGSGTLMGLLMMLSSLPGLVLGPIGGTFADRHSRRAIIIGSDLVLGASLLALASLLFWFPQSPALGLTALCLVAVLTGIVGSLFQPAISAAIPDLVPSDKVAAANSMRQLSSQIAVSVGRAVGGVLYRVLGGPLLFLIDGVTYLFSALSESFITIPQKLPERERGSRSVLASYWRGTREGLAYVWTRPGMKGFLLTVAALNFFFMPVFVLLPFYVDLYLDARADAYGFIMAGFSVGAFVGSILAGSIRVSGRMRAVTILACLLVTSSLFGVLALARHLVVAVGTFTIIGTAVAVINVHLITLLQMTTPAELRGRVLGLEMALTRVASPIGMGLGGMMGDLTGRNIPLLFLVCGGAPFTITLLAALRPKLWTFLAWEPADGQGEGGPEGPTS